METWLIISLILVVLALVLFVFKNQNKGGDIAGYEVRLELRESQIEEMRLEIERRNIAEQERQASIIALAKSESFLNSQLSASQSKVTELQHVITELKGSEEQLQKRLETQFEVISNRIIEDSRNKVNEFNAGRMQELLKPLESDLKSFREQISNVHKEQTRERTELEVKIKQMVEISQGMSTEAKNLSNALRGNNKTAGNWGETILENILQSSGLTVGSAGYELQSMLRDSDGKAHKNEDGRKMIPDAIVHFPGERHVIIDSKVSITAYTDYCAATDEAERKQHLKRHIASIKSHIEGLNVKGYEGYVDGSLDFVMMFIPNDFAAMVALQEDLHLWQNAYSKKILIISPTNLITSLKIVCDLWSREKQQQNVEAILERGSKLLDKCALFEESFEKIGEGLKSFSKIYQSADTQLRGNGGIARQAEMLQELGVKSKKRLAMRSNELTSSMLQLDDNAQE